ncbi:protease [Lentimicrobium sp. L6]|uniref:S41 family peptidase n=1 Tax=Lentimicrobium sp. L6 TaxID=2735916 RepID=UPI001555896B|nr:S41 family peptidase [Lentimicrobium sp. L6]NPD84535.1 protease [Lentimicrobium sp. L6]
MKKFLAFFLSILFVSSFAQESKMMRFPTMHGNQVVFTYAGDLYTVAKTGGIARKMTNDEGFEMFAKFSPDGKSIAFTGQMDGNTEVYTMAAQGGQPERLTYTATLGRDDVSDRMGPNNIVMTWKDNENIVFRSRKQTFNSFKGSLFMVNIDGELDEQLPFSYGGFCSYSPDTKKIAYNRVFREFRTWKYYQGGMADDVWIYDFTSEETINITDNVHQDIFPMWHEDKVYYISDRDRVMNLFEYDINTKQTKKVTKFDRYDIKFPSLGDNGIIFENGGELHYYDFASSTTEKVEVTILNDFPETRAQLKDASKSISSWAVSPDGNRVVFGARGDVFTLPAKSGITRNLTETSGVHERNVEWSPKGKYISYISDVSGEDEIYIVNQNGQEEAIQLTKDSDTYKFNPIWSPDGKYLLWGDKKLRLQMINVETKTVSIVAQAESWEMRDYAWSPDSKWITYTLPQSGTVSKVMVYNIDDKSTNAITNDWYDANSPSFSSDGKYLFFVSGRDFNPIYSRTEWNHAYQEMDKIYFVSLEKSTPSPFAPENDEVKIEETDKKEADKKEEESELSVRIDFDGIYDRTIAMPVDVANYWNVSAIDDNVYFAKWSRGAKGVELHKYNLKSQSDDVIGSSGSYVITADHKKMFISDQGKYAVIPLPQSKINVKDWISTKNMKVMVEPKDEWNQIYNDAWRQMRDFFYDEKMHGVDWKNIQSKYSSLVPYVNNRYDLTYIMGEMIGELSVGHAYINGGDVIKPERVKMGLLGAQLTQDKNGYYKIERILRGQNWNKSVRSPLSDVGVNISEGDYILAVDGKSVKEVKNIFELLVNKADIEVILTVNSKSSTEGGHDEIIIPIKDEASLYYYDWVQSNIDKVNKATNGQVGYIHIPDMGPEGLNEFVKHFYPQLNKKALIIDDRGNGGGNVSPMIIERLNRELTMYGMARNTGITTKPAQILNGPKVLLLDNYSASDGDLFPYQFKKLGIGTTIGVRSWGGVVGIRGSLPFIDGADLRKPEFAPFDVEGEKWVIEGYGVDPDIEIRNDPAKEFKGIDQQLDKAIEVILEQMKAYPETPQIPTKPNKSK